VETVLDRAVSDGDLLTLTAPEAGNGQGAVCPLAGSGEV
jgi:hypothetical protein